MPCCSVILQCHTIFIFLQFHHVQDDNIEALITNSVLSTFIISVDRFFNEVYIQLHSPGYVQLRFKANQRLIMLLNDMSLADEDQLADPKGEYARFVEYFKENSVCARLAFWWLFFFIQAGLLVWYVCVSTSLLSIVICAVRLTRDVCLPRNACCVWLYTLTGFCI